MNTRQSIETRYLGPTNHRCSRIVATTPSGHRLVYDWEHGLNIEANHYAAAKALQAKLEWGPIKAGGSTKTGFVWLTSTLDDIAHKPQTSASDLLNALDDLTAWTGALAIAGSASPEAWAMLEDIQERAVIAMAKAKGE